jgi:hypothetical protein
VAVECSYFLSTCDTQIAIIVAAKNASANATNTAGAAIRSAA